MAYLDFIRITGQMNEALYIKMGDAGYSDVSVYQIWEVGEMSSTMRTQDTVRLGAIVLSIECFRQPRLRLA